MPALTVAARGLVRARWFTVTAMLTVALGLGTSVTIFSIVDRALLRSLPYRDADRLVWIASLNQARSQYSKSAGWDFNAWRGRTAIFAAVEAYWDRPFTMTATEHPEALVGWQFTPTLFTTLGVGPALGRAFVADDGRPGRDNVVVLSDALWRRRFGAAPDVAGRVLQLDGRDYTVIGVMPAAFTYPYPGVQLWTPLPLTAPILGDRKQRALRVIARLQPGVSRERAEAELRAISERAAADFPDSHAGWTTAVRPLRDFYMGDSARLLWILQGTAIVLLLIAASNVASLVLVRASGRERETAIRRALGAGRLELLRLHVTEGLMLAGLGALGGLFVAVWGTRIVPTLLATQLRGLAMASGSELLDGRVLLATAAATIAIGTMFGLAPLLTRAGTLSTTLQSSTRGAVGHRRTRILRSAIVTTQIALSVALLVGAGLLVRSFARLQAQSFGFQTHGVITAQLQLPRDRYPDASSTARFLNQLVSALAVLPGVQAAAAVNTLPLTGFNALRPYSLPGSPPEERMAEFRVVTPGYFRAMAIPLRRGRTFDERDRIASPDVIVVNETLARHLWPSNDPVGQRLAVGDFLTPSEKTVIGVVGDTRHHDLARQPEAEIYRPAYQTYWPFFGLVVRSATAPEQFERSLRAAASSADRNVPISAIQSLDDLADSTLAWRRSSMALMTIFAAAALFLAAVGVYGVMAYSVAERSREIGLRMALGARPRDVARTVVTQAALVSGLGVTLGAALAATLTGILGTLLFGVAPLDPLTFAGASVGTLAASLMATVLPALSATRVDPNVALRAE
jgi:putative ABC transport system permease protein